MNANPNAAYDTYASVDMDADEADEVSPRLSATCEPMDEDDLDAQMQEHETFVKSWYEGLAGSFD